MRVGFPWRLVVYGVAHGGLEIIVFDRPWQLKPSLRLGVNLPRGGNHAPGRYTCARNQWGHRRAASLGDVM
eukprot:4666741-Pyramimonas_sp.AAC.1